MTHLKQIEEALADPGAGRNEANQSQQFEIGAATAKADVFAPSSRVSAGEMSTFEAPSLSDRATLVIQVHITPLNAAAGRRARQRPSPSSPRWLSFATQRGGTWRPDLTPD
jgi:hypothetical protein